MVWIIYAQNGLASRVYREHSIKAAEYTCRKLESEGWRITRIQIKDANDTIIKDTQT